VASLIPFVLIVQVNLACWTPCVGIGIPFTNPEYMLERIFQILRIPHDCRSCVLCSHSSPVCTATLGRQYSRLSSTGEPAERSMAPVLYLDAHLCLERILCRSHEKKPNKSLDKITASCQYMNFRISTTPDTPAHWLRTCVIVEIRRHHAHCPLPYKTSETFNTQPPQPESTNHFQRGMHTDPLCQL
jgi:hypothetical protein